METRNCPRCGKLFQYIKSPICERCVKEEEKIFESVKEYLEENSGSTLIEVSAATGVSIKKITGYLRDGRLEITKGMVGELVCMDCGKPIRSGRYCETCLLRLSNEIDGMFGKRKTEGIRSKGNPKMHHTKNF